MRRAIITCVLIGIYNVFGLTTSFQQEVVRFERGEHPDKIDDDIENRIEAELSERNPMLAEHGSLLFRVKTLIVQIDSSDQDVEAQTAVAKRIISSVRVD